MSRRKIKLVVEGPHPDGLSRLRGQIEKIIFHKTSLQRSPDFPVNLPSDLIYGFTLIFSDHEANVMAKIAHGFAYFEFEDLPDGIYGKQLREVKVVKHQSRPLPVTGEFNYKETIYSLEFIFDSCIVQFKLTGYTDEINLRPYIVVS